MKLLKKDKENRIEVIRNKRRGIKLVIGRTSGPLHCHLCCFCKDGDICVANKLLKYRYLCSWVSESLNLPNNIYFK